MQKLILFLFIMTTYCTAYACEICGCGTGNYYLGMMPQYQKNFIGVRYIRYSFTSHIGDGYSPYEATEETFQTTELWMRYYVTKRIQLMSLIDYNFNTQTEQSETKHLQGMGDIPILVNYNILNTTYQPLSDAKILNHNLFIGGGFKLPTGKHKFREDPNQVANANFQLGTGSVDFIVSAMYTLRFKRFGLSADTNYKINSKNSNEYQFGNRASSTISLFYIQQIKKFGLVPHAGMYFEDSEKNKQYNVVLDNTGGTASLFSAGLETYYKKISIGINFQTPVAQNLASGQSKMHDKLTAHVTFLF